jgi:hypothetical protein
MKESERLKVALANSKSDVGSLAVKRGNYKQHKPFIITRTLTYYPVNMAIL